MLFGQIHTIYILNKQIKEKNMSDTFTVSNLKLFSITKEPQKCGSFHFKKNIYTVYGNQYTLQFTYNMV